MASSGQTSHSLTSAQLSCPPSSPACRFDGLVGVALHESVVVEAVTDSEQPVLGAAVWVEQAVVPVPLQLMVTSVTVAVWQASVRVAVASWSESVTMHPLTSAQVDDPTCVETVFGAPSTVDTTKDVVVEQIDAVCVSHLVASGSEGKVGMWSLPTLVNGKTMSENGKKGLYQMIWYLRESWPRRQAPLDSDRGRELDVRDRRRTRRVDARGQSQLPS